MSQKNHDGSGAATGIGINNSSTTTSTGNSTGNSTGTGTGTNMIRPRLVDRSMSSGTSTMSISGPGPASLVPIWALAHSNKIDHSSKATGVSTSIRTNNRGNGTTVSNGNLMQGQMQGQGSYLQRSANSNSNVNHHDEMGRRPPQGGTSRHALINRYTSDEDDAVSEYNGTKTWIRSGNKWIITHSGDRIAGLGPSDGGGSDASIKVNPTAVSSYGKSSNVQNEHSPNHNLPRSNANATSTSENMQILSPSRPRLNHQAAESASAISSFARSSTSGLYTRQRLTKTPGGFPFMPALHLSQKKESGGITVTSGITRNSNAGSGVTEKSRFQRSYLLNAKPVSNTDRGVNSYTFPLQEKDSSREKMDRSNSGSHLHRQTSSGYDSEREERLREWKEKFVQKFIGEDAGGNDNSGRIRKTKSLDSECDSEVNSNTARTKEWKEEQYRRSDKMIPSGARSRSHSRSQKGNLSYTTSPAITPTASRITDCRNEFGDPDISKRDTFDTEHDSFNYTDRMKEWKDKQYQDYGVSFQPLPTQVEVFGESASKSVDYDYEAYDSDPSRKQRLKEWKEQFASAPVRFPSTAVETGSETRDGNISDYSQDQEHSLETINSPATKSARRGRGRAVPGGGLFPITSPQRKNSARTIGTEGSPFLRPPAKLPPISPPRNLTDPGNMLTPKRSNNSPDKIQQQSNSKEANILERVDGTHVVAKAAKFLLGLSPQSSSEEGPLALTGDCLSTAMDMSSSCKVLPSLSLKPYDEYAEDTTPAQGVMQLPLNLWNKARSHSPYQSDDSFLQIGDTPLNSMHSSDSPLQSWDNCLYVKAEGARNGRICITATHLVFIYEDDVSASLLARYGWNRDQIDSFLVDIEGPSSRGATPVNVPLDESGEGGGIELIGSDNSTVNFMDLLENGFANSDVRVIPEGQEKENLFDKMENPAGIDSLLSSVGSSVSPRDTLNASVVVETLEGASSLLTEDRTKKVYLDEIPPISLSSSSFESINAYEETQKIVQNQPSSGNSFGMASNEEVVNSCIIRAFNEEAHRRLREDERTASHSAVHRLSAASNGSDLDCEDLYRNQTNISSFSEIDMEIDPDQERTLYISGEVHTKQKYIGIKWPLSELAEIFDRRYMMKEVGLEIFARSPSQLTTSSLRQAMTTSTSTLGGYLADEVEVPLGPLSRSSVYLVIPGFSMKMSSRFRRKKISRRDVFVEALACHATQLNYAYWLSSPRLQRKWEWRRSPKTDPVSALTRAWRKGHVSNFDYLVRLNAISGRSFHDPGNYPIMPWVLSNFTSESVPDLTDERNYRDLSKPMGALCPDRLRKFQEKYASLCGIVDTAIPPFMYGSHYSNTGGVVLHYLVRVRPFAGLHRQLQVSSLRISISG